MKRLPLLLVIFAGLWLGFVALRADEPTYGQSIHAIPAELSGEVPVGCFVRRFSVEGMCCDTCPKKLHAALVALEGVREAAIDVETGTAAAVVDSEVAVERVLAALNVDKYSASPAP